MPRFTDVSCRFFAGTTFPLVMETASACCLNDFLSDARHAAADGLAKYGAILFRGFNHRNDRALTDVFAQLSIDPVTYTYRSTPRTTVAADIYTATEYPSSLEIFPHSECSYQRDWPMRIAFHCVTPAKGGGQTPLCDLSRVSTRIGADLLERFRRDKVMYVRNYSEFIDLPWQTVFQTDSREAVEIFCSSHDIQCVWTEQGLRTTQVCQGTAKHPVTGQEVWFNQSHLFHVSSLGQEAAVEMIETFGEEQLPRNAYFGDGSNISRETIDEILSSFHHEAVAFDWQTGDILVLDNMRIAHGRRSFIGPRRVLVSMGASRSSLRA